MSKQRGRKDSERTKVIAEQVWRALGGIEAVLLEAAATASKATPAYKKKFLEVIFRDISSYTSTEKHTVHAHCVQQPTTLQG